MPEDILVHPNSTVHPGAAIGKNVKIGPYAVIGENLSIGANTQIGACCVLDGHTQIGSECKIFTGAVLGSIPQDLKFEGEKTQLYIGNNNTIREYVTINLGTEENGKTVVGDNNLFMAYSHVAHDCRIGNNCVVANAGTFAGHVTLEDNVILGGMTAVHQFTRIGRNAIIGGCSKVVQDIPPYTMSDGHPARIFSLNNVGLSRANVPAESISRLKIVFRILFKEKLSMTNAVEKVKKEVESDCYVDHLIAFIQASTRGISRGAGGTRKDNG